MKMRDSLKLGFGDGNRASFQKPSDEHNLHISAVYAL